MKRIEFNCKNIYDLKQKHTNNRGRIYKMKKNILILAMSTLNKNNTVDIVENRFAWEKDDEIGYAYRGQLEPISTMIREREGSLDRVVILATKETREKRYDSNMTSAVGYYLQRMNISESDAKVIPVEEEEFIPAIAETVEEIRKYWKENLKNGYQVKLWIDTQGSFRNINLVLNAIITLLEMDGNGIVPSGVYSINFSSDNGIKNIVDQTNNYKIFQFVSGINEFIRSGRAEQLEDYYHYIKKDIPLEVKFMKNIAETIQMCNIKEFDKYLNDFRRYKKGKENKRTEELIEIFQRQIEADYGNLLEDNCTCLDVVEWFYKKGFYQQAITYIEAKIPMEWKEKGIISYHISDKVLNDLKCKLRKKNEEDVNVITSHLGVEMFQWGSICYNKNGIRKCNIDNDLMKGRKKDYQTLEKLQNITLYTYNNNKRDKQIGNMSVDIHCKDQNKVMDMLLLYKILKKERNNFNHMLENDVRATKAELGEVIRMFIEKGRYVYENIC